eukprot:gb/GECG01008789.1/.p1 GENE.gb/GECG01008789.1/~~gb/GECG01008789.1/.p1  ORF type:complete len:194 (+),score=28.84 gb/GECG01008789.1/:1-582(+)
MSSANDNENQQPPQQQSTHTDEEEEPHLGEITADSESAWQDGDNDQDGDENSGESSSAGHPETNVKDWIQAKVKAEVDRLNSLGQGVIPVEVRNCSVIKGESASWMNRIEANTSFDFEQIQQVLRSEPEPCPVKQGYSFVYVVLFTNKLPLLVPYIYSTTGQYQSNDLTEWVFINNKMQEARRWVESYSDIQG